MKTVFLDLDGTLTDPAEGITSAINHALTRLGRAPQEPSEMGWVIGPPLIDTFARLGVDDPEEAVEIYREQYRDTGLYQNTRYPGIIEALAAMREAGLNLVLMTAKPHVFAKRITAHFGIAPYLQAEFGPEMDGTRKDKWDLLAYALKELGIESARSVMVGDRLHDFQAASRNGMASLAVGWGYGSDEELSQATARCDSVADLPGAVMRMMV